MSTFIFCLSSSINMSILPLQFDGQTLLHIASFTHNDSALSLLHDHKANPEIADRVGVLHVNREKRQQEQIPLKLSRLCNVDIILKFHNSE